MFSRVNNSAYICVWVNIPISLTWQFLSCDPYTVISNQASSRCEDTKPFEDMKNLVYTLNK